LFATRDGTNTEHNLFSLSHLRRRAGPSHTPLVLLIKPNHSSTNMAQQPSRVVRRLKPPLTLPKVNVVAHINPLQQALPRPKQPRFKVATDENAGTRPRLVNMTAKSTSSFLDRKKSTTTVGINKATVPAQRSALGEIHNVRKKVCFFPLKCDFTDGRSFDNLYCTTPLSRLVCRNGFHSDKLVGVIKGQGKCSFVEITRCKGRSSCCPCWPQTTEITFSACGHCSSCSYTQSTTCCSCFCDRCLNHDYHRSRQQ
jgi:hypothetical protein